MATPRSGPIWLGDNSWAIKRVIERLHACSACATTPAATPTMAGWALPAYGSEDGVTRCAMKLLFSLQHLGYTIAA